MITEKKLEHIIKNVTFHSFLSIMKRIKFFSCVKEQKYCAASCSKNGKCERGRCLCDKNWTGTNCELPACGIFNCTINGVCMVRKNEPFCKCSSGFTGVDCLNPCPPGKFGVNCENDCNCNLDNAVCHSITGKCVCRVGYFGEKCDQPCEAGFYGIDCRLKCPDQCLNCDFKTGNCLQEFNFDKIVILSKFQVFMRFSFIFSAIYFTTSFIF